MVIPLKIFKGNRIIQGRALSKYIHLSMTHLAFIDNSNVFDSFYPNDLGCWHRSNCLSTPPFNMFVVLEDGVWEET